MFASSSLPPSIHHLLHLLKWPANPEVSCVSGQAPRGHLSCPVVSSCGPRLSHQGLFHPTLHPLRSLSTLCAGMLSPAQGSPPFRAPCPPGYGDHPFVPQGHCLAHGSNYLCPVCWALRNEACSLTVNSSTQGVPLNGTE